MERLTNTKEEYELLIVPKEEEGFYWWEILSKNGLSVLHSKPTQNKFARDKTMRKYAALIPCAKLQGGVDNVKNINDKLRPVTQHCSDECRDYIQSAKWHRDTEGVSVGDPGVLSSRPAGRKGRRAKSTRKNTCHAPRPAGQDKAKRADAGVSGDHGEIARRLASIVECLEALAEMDKRLSL